MTGSSPSNNENPPQSPFFKGGCYSSLLQREVGRDLRKLFFRQFPGEYENPNSKKGKSGCHGRDWRKGSEENRKNDWERKLELPNNETSQISLVADSNISMPWDLQEGIGSI